MKSINVSAAIIVDCPQHPKKVFVTRKGYGEFKGKWEFPGGKTEKGENCEQTLAREIYEELGVDVKILRHFKTIEYTYPDFHLTMDCFLCTAEKSKIVLKEAMEADWFTGEDLETLDWIPADKSLVPELKKVLE